MVDSILNERETHRHVPAIQHSIEHSTEEQHSLLARPPGYSSTEGGMSYPASLLGNARVTAHGNASSYTAIMQRAQQTHGNRAVQRFVQRSVGPQISVQRDADEEEVARSVVGDAAVKAGDPTETDTMGDKEYAASMSGSTVEEPKAPGEGVATPDKSASASEERARAEQEKQDTREIYERELRRAEQERIRDTSIPLNNVSEENLRGQVRDGAFTPLGGQRRPNPSANEAVQRKLAPEVSVQRETDEEQVAKEILGDAAVPTPDTSNVEGGGQAPVITSSPQQAQENSPLDNVGSMADVGGLAATGIQGAGDVAAAKALGPSSAAAGNALGGVLRTTGGILGGVNVVTGLNTALDSKADTADRVVGGMNAVSGGIGVGSALAPTALPVGVGGAGLATPVGALGSVGLGGALATGGAILGAGAAGYGVGKLIDKATDGALSGAGDRFGKWVYEKINGSTNRP